MNAGREAVTGAGQDRFDLLSRALAVLSAAIVAAGLLMAFVYAPADRVQGEAYRIVYVHAPVAWLAYLAAAVVFVGSVGYLWKRSAAMDRLARSGAELGLLFTTLALVTGSIWGRPIWGTWWEWDARLTTTLILWFIYLGYFMIRSSAGDAQRGARFAAVLGIIGMADVPIIHMSVRWWRTQHPEPVVLDTSGPNLEGSMLVTLLVCFIGFTLLFAHLLVQRIQVERARDILSERALTRMLAPAASSGSRAGAVVVGAEPARTPTPTPPVEGE